MVDYIDQVTMPAIEHAPLEATSRRRYLIGVGHLKALLRGYSISDAVRFRTLEATLQDIARHHGKASAVSSRTALSKYVLQQLIRDEVIDGNPLTGMSIDLSSMARKASTPRRGGQALTSDERDRLVTHLLTLDTTTEPPPWTIDKTKLRPSTTDKGKPRPSTRAKAKPRPSTRAKFERVVALTLLQAGTGLRVSEANHVRWTDTDVDDDGILNITVHESKTDRARRIPVLDPRINEYFVNRQPDDAADSFLIGSPMDRSKAWEDGNCRKCVASSYTAWAARLDIPLLEHARTHIWRTTLNELTKRVLSREQRAAFFGHTEEINARAYTDLTNIDGIASAVGSILDGSKTPDTQTKTGPKTTHKTTRKLRVVQ